MIRVEQLTRKLPYYAPIPLTDLPLLYQREHLFPYTSFGDTAADPVSREFRIVALENDLLRLEVAPELGGRVYSLMDKRIRQEILFRNPVVRPVRILPIWGFISGGIEFNFPIAHSPTSLAEVGCMSGVSGNYGFIRVGEREARTGMEWVVELGLLEGSPFLVQRTALRNRSGCDHPWMLWTITAVRSTPGTEFLHPPHRVLVHDHRLVELDWPNNGLNWDRNFSAMTALFWKPGDFPQFGAFHHDLGFGLLHLANPEQLPGKKVWTYGHGKHRAWAQATTAGDLAYAEIESGPLVDQSQKPIFPSGTEMHFEEFWLPVNSAASFKQVTLPKLDLPGWSEPWLGWQHSPWQSAWEAFAAGTGRLPNSAVATGLELEGPLRRELESGNRQAAEPLALWLAFRGRPQDALSLLESDPDPKRRRIAGLILWKGLNQPTNARSHLEAGPLQDPIAVVELDELYAELGLVPERSGLLARAPSHRRVIERRADLALARGRPQEALALLRETPWPFEHQRYVRTELWRAAKARIGEPDAETPDFLNEDNLARFGAYWSD